MNDKILIVGKGQIGTAMGEIEEEANNEVTYIDENSMLKPQEFDVMHICFPYFNETQFITECEKYFKFYESKFVFIHSTVAPGTTDKIEEKINHSIIYSPVIGKHPYLKKSLKTFCKFTSCNDTDIGKWSTIHLKNIGITSEYIGKPINAELAKLLSTTRYGIDIAYATFVNKMCKEFDADFSQVYTNWTRRYNEGYMELGDDKFIRPILEPNEGGIGGHCITSNAEILIDYIDPKEQWLQHIFECGKDDDK